MWFIIQENIKILKINFWLWFEIVIIFKVETHNLQGIDTFTQIHIYSQLQTQKKNSST